MSDDDPGDPDERDPAGRRPNPDPTALATARLGEYVELWERVVGKMTRADYHSEDLIDDWFTWWGKCVRDVTAASAMAWSALPDEPAARDRSPGP
jgi:hypothetical protein